MKLLVLENEALNEDDSIHTLIKNRFNDYDIQIIEWAYQEDKEILVKAILSTDVLLFATTWLRHYQIKPFGKLLAIANPLEIYCISRDSASINYHLEEIFELETLKDFHKHTLYHVKHYLTSNPDWVKKVDIQSYKDMWEKKEKERIEKNHSFKKTGYKILIKDVKTNTPIASTLNEGDIVDELNCEEIDPNPSRGAWVMGDGEPIKLLNDDGYEEFEYAELKCWALAKEFASRGRKKDEREIVGLIAQQINGYTGKLKMDNAKLWLWCDELCNLLGLERRNNRTYFERRIQQYREKYVYFCELNKLTIWY